MSICELDSVSKVYGSGEGEVFALKKVSLGFQPGEFTVIGGPSGSGKTTMLNMIGLLDKPSKGTVTIAGKLTSTLSDAALTQVRSEHIGFIFQSFNLIPVLSALENVEVALNLSGHDAGSVRKLASEALESVGLGSMLKRRPTQLSGGQQQRVAIARALVKKPSIVIADEPTANLDSTSGANVLDLMKDLNEKNGVTFLFSTHDPMVIERARRVVQIRDGAVLEDSGSQAKGAA